MKFLKPSRVVLVTQGRFAGKKAVILQNVDSPGNKERPYGHAVVAGIRRYPRRIVNRRLLTKNQIRQRQRVIPFIRVVNHAHLMPTRYNIDMGGDIKGKISIADPSKKKASKTFVRRILQKKYEAGHNKWFFEKLHF
eukprot:TRINITY_DN12838_c0_g1_i1.p2 TRINITY_DN12838_c0_g1~~TRINITY_DN12838_c0_g1_i1.p2  ORF type:complete len:137 (-),score=32.28 TRINITY_DN12838_c0_g1_i1:160-570(-)